METWYNTTMDIHEFVRSRKELFWSTKNSDGLDIDAIVETILNYDDRTDVTMLIKILGMGEVARVFRSHTGRRRGNYLTEVSHFFTLYFQRHA